MSLGKGGSAATSATIPAALPCTVKIVSGGHHRPSTCALIPRRASSASCTAANAARSQAGLQRKFYDQADPTLPEAERQRRACAAFRAHMAKLAFDRSKRA